MVEEEGKGRISDKIDEIYSLVKSEKKEDKKKLTKLEKKIRISKAKREKNFVTLLILKANASAEIQKLPIINDSVKLKKQDTYHVATSEYIWTHRQFPFMILPEWDMKPISRKRLVEKTIEDKTWASPQKLLIHYMEVSKVKPKMSLGGKGLFFVIIGVLIVLYLLSSVLKGG